MVDANEYLNDGEVIQIEKNSKGYNYKIKLTSANITKADLDRLSDIREQMEVDYGNKLEVKTEVK